jgi:predicted small lipoprotein YifL
MRRVIPAALLAVTLAVALAACDPGGGTPSSSPSDSASPTPTESVTPTPEPETRPALADLALGPDGFEQLPLGEVPTTDPALAMVTFDAAACGGQGVWNADPSFISTDPDLYGPGTAFTVTSDGPAGPMSRIDLNANDIPTTAGIRFGDSRAAVEAAYPGAAVVPAILTDIYVVTGSVGTLQIEVAADASYWAGFRPNETVVYIHASVPSWGTFSVAASENLLGVCHV